MTGLAASLVVACSNHRKARHLSCVCTPQMPVVVEPHFKENFSIASATPAYRRLLGAAPGEFVGSVSRLAAIVELLSEGVKRAFAEQGLPLPPWRRAKSVMSKWGMGPHAHGESLIFFYSHTTYRAGAPSAALEARPP